MRIRRLGLSRYGMFTDHTINFGERISGNPDLHIVYGANEAGKSTALSGYLDLLFAIELRSPYSFLHGYPAMRIEGDLEIGGQTHRLVRVRKRTTSLINQHGQPVADGVIANALSGIDRNAYKTMFSLDDYTLEKGGEEILRSEGDLGQLLFATSAGLVDLSIILSQLRNRADEFHKRRGRRTRFYRLRQRLRNLQADRKRLDTAASAFARLIIDRDKAKLACDAAVTERVELETKRDEIERRIQGMLWLDEIHKLREEYADLEPLPNVPQTWFNQIHRIIDQEPRLTTRQDDLNRQNQKLSEMRAALVVDHAILDLENFLTQMTDARARYVTATADLPSRRAKLSEYDRQIRTVTHRLGESSDTDPKSLVVPTIIVGELNALIEQRSGLDERVRMATSERNQAQASLIEAERSLIEISEKVGSTNEAELVRLNALTKAIQEDDYRARLAMYRQRQSELTIELDAQLAQLHPWQGTAEVLAGVRVPERNELEAWKSVLDVAATDIIQLERDKVRLLGRRDKISGRLAAKRAESGVIEDAEARELRKRRDEAWQIHRAKLDAISADTFAEHLKADDNATEIRIANAMELADLRHASENLREINLELEQNSKELTIACRRQRHVQKEVTTAVQAMVNTGAEGLSSNHTIAKLAAWTDRRANILKTLLAINRQNVEINRAGKDESHHRERLSNVMTAAGLARDSMLTLDDLVAVARSCSRGEQGSTCVIKNCTARG